MRHRLVGVPRKESVRVVNWLVNAYGLSDPTVARRLHGELMYALESSVRMDLFNAHVAHSELLRVHTTCCFSWSDFQRTAPSNSRLVSVARVSVTPESLLVFRVTPTAFVFGYKEYMSACWWPFFLEGGSGREELFFDKSSNVVSGCGCSASFTSRASQLCSPQQRFVRPACDTLVSVHAHWAIGAIR